MTHRHPRATPASVPLWHVANVELVKAHLANAALRAEPPCTIGDVTLMPHQRQALARVRDSMHRFHGALLADEVGLGKTYVALALAREYDTTHVIAPAALLPMWHSAIDRAAAHQVTLHSLRAFSRPRHTTNHRDHPAPHAPTPSHPKPRRELVVIDEAHHLRTRNTKRYRAVAQFVAGRDLLLLSATPIHNSARELRNLLALFTGQRDDLLDANSLAQLVIRQDHPTDSPTHRDSQPTPAAAPRIHQHPPTRLSSAHSPQDRAALDAILSLPDPLPARDGAVAGALIRLGLLRAWCSSNATLCHVLRRRLLRGEALRHALQSGRHPSQAELRTWLVGDHEVQLAFPELLAQPQPDSAPLLERLDKHLDALRALLDTQRSLHNADSARALALRHILAQHPDARVIAFSQFSHTVQALYRALSDIAGVGALTGMHARIASGRIARLDAIARFAPHAQGKPQPPPHQAIRLLLSTDLLAEGVNLQDAAVVVHLDLPWTDALKRQRVGRIARLGSPHTDVHVYTLAPPILGDRALQLSTRLLRKAAIAADLIGTTTHTPSSTPHANGKPRSTPALVSHIQSRLQSWQDSTLSQQDHHPIRVPVAAVHARTRGWIAALSLPDGPQLVAHIRRTGVDLPLLAQAIAVERTLPHASRVDFAALRPSARQVAHVHRQLTNWYRTEELREALGVPHTALSAVQQRALRCLTHAIAALPPLHRRTLAPLAHAAESIVYAARADGPQHALARWTALAPVGNSPSIQSIRDWLIAWRDLSALAAVDHFSSTPSDQPRTRSHHGLGAEAPPAPVPAPLRRPLLLALLLLRPTTAADAALCSSHAPTRSPL